MTIRCDRCTCPLEEPITYADTICGPYQELLDGVCEHVPLCTACTEWHRVEVAEHISS